MLRCSLFITVSVVRIIDFSLLLFASFSARLFILDDSWGKYACILYYHQGALCSGGKEIAVLEKWLRAVRPAIEKAALGFLSQRNL